MVTKHDNAQIHPQKIVFFKAKVGGGELPAACRGWKSPTQTTTHPKSASLFIIASWNSVLISRVVIPVLTASNDFLKMASCILQASVIIAISASDLTIRNCQIISAASTNETAGNASCTLVKSW
jgi:hypothetical protein